MRDACPQPSYLLDIIVLIIFCEGQCTNYEYSQLTLASLPLLPPTSVQIFSKHFPRRSQIVFSL
jgi:hypothetical protein